MSPGKKKRLQRIFQDGRTVMVPMDHGVTSGPIQGLVDMQAIVNKIQEGGADAVIVHKGIAKNIDTGRLGLVLHLSASTRLGPDPNWKVKVCTVEEALRMGADAVSVHVNFGAAREPEMLMKLSSVADECDKLGVPLLAMMYPRGPSIPSEHDPEAVAHAARLGAELGADIIKTNYTGNVETFRRVVEGCPVPVVIAGGPKAKTDREVLEMVYDSLKAGGRGVSIGRNVFQNENPAAMVKALSAIVHRNATVEEALKILGEAK
jgi:fructose-bisphosphate aldolase/2-amino-3,7-dideoxy-D-threo-hept-6-ulosonate synthase